MYQQTTDIEGNLVALVRVADNACIPLCPENTDYQTYCEWVAQGNEPLADSRWSIDTVKAIKIHEVKTTAREKIIALFGATKQNYFEKELNLMARIVELRSLASLDSDQEAELAELGEILAGVRAIRTRSDELENELLTELNLDSVKNFDTTGWDVV